MDLTQVAKLLLQVGQGDFQGLPGVDLAWAAGIFEGEGTIVIHPRKNGKGDEYFAVILAVAMTDEDVVRRFHEVVGVGKFYGPYLRDTKEGNPKKPLFKWTTAAYEPARIVLEALMPFLGVRRKEQARKALSAIEHHSQL